MWHKKDLNTDLSTVFALAKSYDNIAHCHHSTRPIASTSLVTSVKASQDIDLELQPEVRLENKTWFWSTPAHLLQPDQLLVMFFIVTIFRGEDKLL